MALGIPWWGWIVIALFAASVGGYLWVRLR